MNFLKEEKTKKLILLGCFIIIMFSIIFIIITNIQYRKYTKTLNSTINNIANKITKEYPNVNEEEIIKILKESNTEVNAWIKQYGYSDDIPYIQEIRNEMKVSIIVNIAFITIFGGVVVLIYILDLYKQHNKIKEIYEYLQQINSKNYILELEENEENELSKLRNELYKTTILLKESAQASAKEKEQLSNALADISHQLKTPLTSIRIMLDNIYENPNMDKTTRDDFMREISKQTDWISSLVIALLKVTKFDAGAIKMNNTTINVKELINNAISNLSILLEIRNIQVIPKIDDEILFIGDYKWQLEAITNIIKNSAEHSKENSRIYINVEATSLFVKIIIKDEGEGIEKQDIKHIFERFYKAKNSSGSSIGIGLSLAKTIIEKNNGYINVESQVGRGTTFEIKYIH